MKFFIELGETEVTNKIKFEPESPTTQFPLSPSSLNHSESNDSDKQITCSAQELSNCAIQDVKTEVTLHRECNIDESYNSLSYV